jgi:glyoxylase-like metal-dependent hydrolase (beta-lactamase superfamily II)
MVPNVSQITPEVFQIGGAGFTAAEDAAVYLVAVDGKAALIDAGCGGSVDQLIANAEACGVRADALHDLFLTHCHFDHTGGAAELKARLALRVVMHALEAPFVETGDPEATAASWYGATLQPFRPDHIIEGGSEVFRIGGRRLEALHMPGHSPGSLVYLLESAGLKVLFGQDVHGPLHSSLKSDRRAYHHSLQRLIELKADVLCEGHFGVVEGAEQVRHFIQQYL